MVHEWIIVFLLPLLVMATHTFSFKQYLVVHVAGISSLDRVQHVGLDESLGVVAGT